MSTSDQPSAGIQPNGEEHRHLSAIVTLIQELTSFGIRSESFAELFGPAFDVLYRCTPFDVAVAVMIEQHLEVYISTRRGSELLIGDAFVTRLRRTLESLIPVSFASADLVVKAEWHDLPARPEARPRSRDHELNATLRLERRVAGLVLIDREEPFAPEDRQVLEIFASQISLLIGNLTSRERILSLADTDELTGIWNKRYLRRQLPQEIERARVYGLPLSLLIFDVDDFKQINDGFGHTVGDVVLSELCGVVREILRPPDFFARFGGDEFAVVLPHTDLVGARAVAQRILDNMSELSIPSDEEGEIRCSVSIGIADLKPGETVTAGDLIRRADERLYDAKRAGKNRYVTEETP